MSHSKNFSMLSLSQIFRETKNFLASHKSKEIANSLHLDKKRDGRDPFSNPRFIDKHVPIQ